MSKHYGWFTDRAMTEMHNTPMMLFLPYRFVTGSDGTTVISPSQWRPVNCETKHVKSIIGVCMHTSPSQHVSCALGISRIIMSYTYMSCVTHSKLNNNKLSTSCLLQHFLRVVCMLQELNQRIFLNLRGLRLFSLQNNHLWSEARICDISLSLLANLRPTRPTPPCNTETAASGQPIASLQRPFCPLQGKRHGYWAKVDKNTTIDTVKWL